MIDYNIQTTKEELTSFINDKLPLLGPTVLSQLLGVFQQEVEALIPQAIEMQAPQPQEEVEEGQE